MRWRNQKYSSGNDSYNGKVTDTTATTDKVTDTTATTDKVDTTATTDKVTDTAATTDKAANTTVTPSEKSKVLNKSMVKHISLVMMVSLRKILQPLWTVKYYISTKIPVL